ncbi:MAG: phosphoribosylglycinamide formyltransferase [Thiolinea sp.]
MSAERKRLVTLISGSGSNLQSLLEGCASGQINGDMVGVLSNRPGVFGLERAAAAGVSAVVVDHTAYSQRSAFEAELRRVIDAWGPDLVLLAGFMRILEPAFVAHYHGRLLNIHPSLLPAYKGTHTHQRVLEAGDAVHGASVHFVTAELDGGPVILQAVVEVLDDDDATQLAQRVLAREHVIYPQAAAWFCADRLQLEAGQVVLDGQRLEQPVRV